MSSTKHETLGILIPNDAAFEKIEQRAWLFICSNNSNVESAKLKRII